jgi:hypothetical protein
MTTADEITIIILIFLYKKLQINMSADLLQRMHVRSHDIPTKGKVLSM